MTLSLEVQLCAGRYDAGGERQGQAEWPPHPARLFCALAASADEPAEWDALRWLERAGLPQVLAEATAFTSRSDTFVVTNRTERDGGSQFWPARTNQLRSRASAVPGTNRFAFVWPQADPDPDLLARLRRLAGRAWYVGRATSRADVSVLTTEPAADPLWTVWVPGRVGSSGARNLRVPYPGYTDQLAAAYASGARAWQVARAAAYCLQPASAGPELLEDPSPSAWGDLVIWGFERGTARVNGDQVVHLTSMLRRAVLAELGRTPVQVPAQISGHGSSGLPHAAFLALPDAGHRHADGHLLGVALAVPESLPPDQWRHLMRTLVSPRFTSITPWRSRTITLEYRGDGRYGLDPERWTGPREGTRRWVTATPIATDGMPRKGRSYEDLVRRTFRNRAYPELADLTVSPAPLIKGAVWRPRAGTLPTGRDHWPLVHADVTFERPVTGPVLAGALRSLGLGLMVPLADRS